MTLTHDNLTEFAPHQFCADAAELGLPPGHWPSVLLTNIGNGQVLIWETFRTGYAVYKQALGCVEVHIFND